MGKVLFIDFKCLIMDHLILARKQLGMVKTMGPMGCTMSTICLLQVVKKNNKK